jgi:hypothetical protein
MSGRPARNPVCPVCARTLRRVDLPDFATIALYVGVELLFWAAVALVLAFLAAPRGEGEWYAGLAAIAIVAWIGLRPGQVSARRAFLGRARYHCETCNRHFQFESQGRESCK